MSLQPEAPLCKDTDKKPIFLDCILFSPIVFSCSIATAYTTAATSPTRWAAVLSSPRRARRPSSPATLALCASTPAACATRCGTAPAARTNSTVRSCPLSQSSAVATEPGKFLRGSAFHVSPMNTTAGGERGWEFNGNLTSCFGGRHSYFICRKLPIPVR